MEELVELRFATHFVLQALFHRPRNFETILKVWRRLIHTYTDRIHVHAQTVRVEGAPLS